MTTADFVELWDAGENSFESDPPNAVLAFLEPGETTPEDAVIVITNPQLDNGSLSYSIDVLEGTVPRRRGPSRCSSTRSGGRCHPCPSQVFGAASAGAFADRRVGFTAETGF